jgi:gamma-glutamylcyclotransferase (GGCT)/AIG2-like uncharacterized protein YtfP|tara:strand:+ start:13169 stop:13537 length:369 start_codon:yes stop_codon:yes gene_type:complete
MRSEKLAVYGTLRRGSDNKGVVENTTLVYPGHTRFPAVIYNEKGKGTIVEVLDVTKEDLNTYDMYEGVKSGMYRRVRTNVKMDDGGKERAWLYVAGDLLLANETVFEVIEGGDWNKRQDRNI